MRRVRHFDYDDFIREKKARYRALFPRLERKRFPKRRPRDKKERGILLELDRARRERWIKEGRLEVLGPHHYRLNPDRKSK
jgi:hypothetical protein